MDRITPFDFPLPVSIRAISDSSVSYNSLMRANTLLRILFLLTLILAIQHSARCGEITIWSAGDKLFPVSTENTFPPNHRKGEPTITVVLFEAKKQLGKAMIQEDMAK